MGTHLRHNAHALNHNEMSNEQHHSDYTYAPLHPPPPPTRTVYHLSIVGRLAKS